MYLPDINVWLALVFEAHAHHIIVQSWFTKIENKTCAMCRMTPNFFLYCLVIIPCFLYSYINLYQQIKL